MNRAEWSRIRSTLAGFVLVAVTLVAEAPTGTAATTPTTPEQLIDAVGVGEVPIDYEILLDTSNSMLREGRYGSVTNALKQFLSGLRPIDHVNIIGFDVTARHIYEGDAQGAAELRMPTPGGLGTDLGAGLQQVITDLERTAASPAAGVVLLTDGIINAPESRYSTLGNPAWLDLATRVEELPADHHVKGFALPLTTSIGAQGLAEVFPDTVVWQDDPSRLSQSLAKVTEEVRTSTAARLLTEDAARGLTVRWPAEYRTLRLTGGEADVALTLTSNTQILPLRVEAPALAPEGFMGAVTGLPEQVELAPGQTVTVTGRLTVPHRSRFSPGRQEAPFSGRLAFNGTATSPWAPLATRLGANVTVPALASNQPFSGTEVGGIPWWILTVLGALLLFLLLAAVRMRLSRPRLTGTVEVDSVEHVHAIELRRRRRLVLRGSDLLGLPGLCELRGRVRSEDERAHEWEGSDDDIPSLQIRYSGGAIRSVSRNLRPGDRTEIGGVGFRYQPWPSHRPSPWPQRGPSEVSGGPAVTIGPAEAEGPTDDEAPRSVDVRSTETYSRLED